MAPAQKNTLHPSSRARLLMAPPKTNDVDVNDDGDGDDERPPCCAGCCCLLLHALRDLLCCVSNTRARRRRYRQRVEALRQQQPIERQRSDSPGSTSPTTTMSPRTDSDNTDVAAGGSAASPNPSPPLSPPRQSASARHPCARCRMPTSTVCGYCAERYYCSQECSNADFGFHMEACFQTQLRQRADSTAPRALTTFKFQPATPERTRRATQAAAVLLGTPNIAVATAATAPIDIATGADTADDATADDDNDDDDDAVVGTWSDDNDP